MKTHQTTIATKAESEQLLQNSAPPADIHLAGPSGNRPAEQLDQKIARLPKATRDMINVMLDDALPYRVILDELAESGRGLTVQTLKEWIHTGHQDYLKHRQTIQDAKTETEFAADLVRELGQFDPTVIQRATLALVSIQIYKVIEEYGEQALGDMLRINPANYIRILNGLCNVVGPTIKLEEHCRALERARETSASPS